MVTFDARPLFLFPTLLGKNHWFGGPGLTILHWVCETYHSFPSASGGPAPEVNLTTKQTPRLPPVKVLFWRERTLNLILLFL